jgi:hypothetical protein
MIPSIFFAYTLFEEKKTTQKINLFIDTEFTNKGYTILYKKINLKSDPKKIDLAFLRKKFNAEEINSLNKTLINYQIENTKLYISQDTTDIKKYILDQIHSGKSNLDAKDIKITQLKNEIESNEYNNKALLNEIKIIFPEVENISISNHTFNKNTDSSYVNPVLIYESRTNLSEPSNQKLKLWLQKRLSKEKIEIYRQEAN